MFYWRRAGSGLYVLRDHAGLGQGIGRVTSSREPGGASFYSAAFDWGGLVLAFRERGSHNTVIKRLEADILQRFPDATFSREGFR